MAEKIPLKIGQKIQVRRKDGKEWYNSGIQDIRAGYIHIIMPFLKEIPLVLRRNEQVAVRFFSENSSFIFDTNVVGEINDNIKLYRLDYPQKINRVQQRSHVRLPVIIDVEYAVLEEEEKEKNKKAAYKKTTTVDLSGGGMKLLTREKIEPGTKILLVISLPLKNRPELLEIKSVVVRCVKVDPNREVYHLGIKFEDISLSQEDKIVRFVFEKMARQKRLR
ncbi:flagellar brake protein [Desulfotruncus alcoholivorax]|uniref:flagellar brake protein n=1 Tax=Desulfotruncus alcoholivorax TaxID=265477 RepID=UPI00048317BE|nr:flagellar brake domain-containing protein [Desulfotruncus alcoholivorax]